MMIIRNYVVKILSTSGVLNAQTDVNQVKIKLTAIQPDNRDSKGRPRVLGYNAKFEFSVMNNQNTSLAAFMLFLEQNPLCHVTLDDEDNADAGAINITNVHIIPEPEFDGNGKHTSAYCWFEKIISRSVARLMMLTEGSATITVAAGANGSVAGGGSFRIGSTVTVTATPAESYALESWKIAGVVVSTTAIFSFPCTGAVTVTAAFVHVDV
jgi:hypothetical protein